MTDEDIDIESYQPGTAEGDEMLDDYNFQESQVHDQSMKETAGRKIYSNRSAAFNEMYSNASTAIKKAVDEGFLEDISEGLIEITVSHHENGGLQLTFRDNGIGMTEEVAREVFLKFGKTDTGKNVKQMGNFGLGVASYPLLPGFEDGTIRAEFNPRRDEEEYLYGFLDFDGLHYKKGTEDFRILDEDEYGVAYGMWLHDDISMTDVNDWIDNVTEMNSVPVEVTVDTSVNTTQYREEPKSPESFVSEDNPHIIYEDEIVTFIGGLDVDKKVYLMHKQVESDVSVDNPFGDNCVVSINVDGQVVCEGEHRGKEVVPDEKYDSLTDLQKEERVPEKDVPENVSLTPRVLGNREKVVDDHNFSEWLSSQVWDEYYSDMERIFDKIDTPSDLFNLPELEHEKVLFGFGDRATYTYSTRNNRRYKRRVQTNSRATIESTLEEITSEEYNYEEGLVDLFYALFHKDYLASVENEKFSNNDVLERKTKDQVPYSIVRRAESRGAPIYFGCSLDGKKVRAVEQDSNAIVVRVNNAKLYDLYENALGWSLLKNVKKDVVKDMNVSDSIKGEFNIGDNKNTSSAGSNEVTIHFGRRQYQKSHASINQIEEFLTTENKNVLDGNKAKTLVAFPTGTDYNLSDFYGYAKKPMGFFNCSKGDYEALSEYESVVHIEDAIESAEETEIQSEDGPVSLETVLSDDNYWLLVEFENMVDTGSVNGREISETVQEMSTEQVVQRLRMLFNEGYDLPRNMEHSWDESMTIAYTDSDTIKKNRLAYYRNDSFKTISLKPKTMISCIPVGITNVTTNYGKPDNVELAIDLVLAEYANTEIFETFHRSVNKLSNVTEGVLLIRKMLEEGYTDHNDEEMLSDLVD